MNKILLSIILGIFLIGLSSAQTYLQCYQETANESNIIDGSCALNYTGSYGASPAGDYRSAYDGNWNEGVSIADTATAYYVNYSVPSYNLNYTGTIWSIKNNATAYYNLTINPSCLTRTDKKLVLLIINTGGFPQKTLSYNCYNQTNMITISNIVYDIIDTNIYEEALYWNISSYTINNISYTASVAENTPSNFILNLNYNDNYYTSATATLYYNNTAYASTKTGSGVGTLFTNSVTSPSVSASTNISFYWTLQLYNGTDYEYYNTSTYNQTITNLVIDDCSSGTFKIMNFTTYDEDSLTRLRKPTYNQTYEIELYLNDVLTYARNRTNVDELVICSNVAITGNISMDYILRYDADGTSTGYVNEFYNVRNFDLNAYTTNQNISLYDLIATNSEECLFTIKDANFLPLNDGLVQITRRYLSDGTYKTVEIPATDSLGKTIGHFVLNDEVYSIYLRKDGNLLASYTNVKAVKPTGSDCIFNLNIPSASSTPEDFTAYGDLLYDSSYDDSTRTYSIDWVTNSGSSSNITLYAYVNGVNVCSNEIVASSGTSQCIFGTSYTNQSARMVLYNSGNVVFEDYVNIGYKRPNLNPIRYLVAAALIPIMVLMAGSSIIVATVFFIMGLILSGGLFLFDTQTMIGAGSFIMWLVIGALILLFKFTRRASNG